MSRVFGVLAIVAVEEFGHCWPRVDSLGFRAYGV